MTEQDIINVFFLNNTHGYFCLYFFPPANKGYFYPAMKADVHKYVRTFSDKSKEWLTKLRKEGRKLFLITNSQADFSMFVLKAAFG